MKTKTKTKTKAAKAVDLTARDFQQTMGLGKDASGYIAATKMLRMLVARGVAKEVARLHVGADKLGRKSVIYRLPLEFTLKTSGGGNAA